MEIRIYASMECFRSGKVLYCARVSDPDSFCYSSFYDVMRCVYGSGVLMVVMSVL